MLTTIDNPFDPWTEYEQWLEFDIRNGHNTNELLARYCVVVEGFPQAEQEVEIQLAMNKIVASALHPFHIIVQEGYFSFNISLFKTQEENIMTS